MSLIAYILTALLGAVIGWCIASELQHRVSRSIYLDLCAERLRRERWKKWAKLWHRRRKARASRLRTWVGCRN